MNPCMLCATSFLPTLIIWKINQPTSQGNALCNTGGSRRSLHTLRSAHMPFRSLQRAFWNLPRQQLCPYLYNLGHLVLVACCFPESSHLAQHLQGAKNLLIGTYTFDEEDVEIFDFMDAFEDHPSSGNSWIRGIYVSGEWETGYQGFLRSHSPPSASTRALPKCPWRVVLLSQCTRHCWGRRNSRHARFDERRLL